MRRIIACALSSLSLVHLSEAVPIDAYVDISNSVLTNVKKTTEDSMVISATYGNIQGTVDVTASTAVTPLSYSFTSTGEAWAKNGGTVRVIAGCTIDPAGYWSYVTPNLPSFQYNNPYNDYKTFVFKEPMTFSGSYSLGGDGLVPSFKGLIAAEDTGLTWIRGDGTKSKETAFGSESLHIMTAGSAYSESFQGTVAPGTYYIAAAAAWVSYGTVDVMARKGTMSFNVTFTPKTPPVVKPPVLELTDINDSSSIRNGDTAWITGESPPKMPALVARLSNPPKEGKVAHWRLVCTYNRPRKAGLPQDTVTFRKDVPIQASDSADPEWNIAAEYDRLPFFGGDAELTCQIDEQPARSRSFKILGKNPPPDVVRNFIEKARDSLAPEAWYAYAICKLENRYIGSDRFYNQFYGDKGKYKSKEGEVVFGGDPAGPGGFGLFQITGTLKDAGKGITPREEIWNWQANVKTGLKIVQAKIVDSDKRMKKDRDRAAREVRDLALQKPAALVPQLSTPRNNKEQLIMDGGDAKYGIPAKARITFKDAGTPVKTAQDQYPTIRDADAIRRFNGGRYCEWIGGSKDQPQGKAGNLGHWRFNGKRGYDNLSYVDLVTGQMDDQAPPYPAPHVLKLPRK